MSKRIILLQALASAPNDLAITLRYVDAPSLHQRPSPNLWSVADVLTHLIEVEAQYRVRLRRIVEEERPYLPYIHPHPQTDPQMTLSNLLDQFRTARDQTVAFLRDLSVGDWQRAAVHETMGETKLRYMVQTLVNHDTEHLNHLVEIIQKRKTTPLAEVQPAIPVKETEP